jgi:ribosomal protein S18 acetylase RimI-like enzyme
MSTSPAKGMPAVSVRTMRETDLVEARRIFRLAFGTFLGVPDPENFWTDREYVFTRWRSDPDAAFVAEINTQIAGSNFVTKWGTFGFFGPLTVRPDLWNQRVAQAILGPTMDLFAEWRVREAGLFTFAHSSKHIALYQKFGFWPRFLTAIMSKSANSYGSSALKISSLTNADQEQALSACRALTDSVYQGLDVTSEIRSVNHQGLGDTVLLWGGSSLEAFAVCHCGQGPEAGRDTCYIKFAAVQPRVNADIAFDRMLDACESLAAERRLVRLEAGVNLNRSRAYRRMLQRGFRTDISGVAMHRPDSPAYNRPEIFVIDDWR